MSRAGGGARAAGGGEASRLQAEMLQLDLIDAAGDAPAEEQTAPEPLQKDPPAGTTDVYRPKRPTTLNLFPQVPRSQVRPGPGRGEQAGGVRGGGGGRMLPPPMGFCLGGMKGWREGGRDGWRGEAGGMAGRGSAALPAMPGKADAPPRVPSRRCPHPRAGRGAGSVPAAEPGAVCGPGGHRGWSGGNTGTSRSAGSGGGLGAVWVLLPSLRPSW